MSFYDVNPTAMPVADMVQGSRRFVNVMNEDFLTPVPVGGFTPKTNSPGSGSLVTGAAATPYASKLMVYPSGFSASSNGKSRPEKVLSVENSCLTYNFSIDPTTGEAMAATVHYLVGSDDRNGTSYPGYYIPPTVGGRFMFRFRVVNSPGLLNWGAVSQVIASDADWGAMHGEMDLNEGDLSKNMQTNWHQYQSANTFAPWGAQPWGDSVWHTTCYDWIPVGDPLEPAGRETVWIDGVKVGESVGDRIAQNYRTFFAFQTGVNAVPPEANGSTYAWNGSTRGQLQVDWVSVYRPTVVQTGKVQVSRVRVAPVPVPTGKVQVSRVRLAAVPTTPTGKVQVSRVGALSAGLPPKIQVSRVGVQAASTVSYTATVEPLTAVLLPTGVWTQTSGPTCAPGAVAPALLDGCRLTYSSGSNTAVVTVLPNTAFFDAAAQLPVRIVTA